MCSIISKDKAFGVIKDFIYNAKNIMTKQKPVALWNLSLKKSHPVGDEKDFNEIKNHTLEVFEEFVNQHVERLHTLPLNSLKFPPNTILKYNDAIYVDLNKLVEMCDSDDLLCVKEYIMTIGALLCSKPALRKKATEVVTKLKNENSTSPPPSIVSNTNLLSTSGNGGGNLSKALGIDDSTNEGQYISSLLGKVQNIITEDDMKNPQQAIMKLMMSGVLSEMMSGAKDKMSSGEMTLSGMMNTLQHIVNVVEKTSANETVENAENVSPDNENEKNTTEGVEGLTTLQQENAQNVSQLISSLMGGLTNLNTTPPIEKN